MQTCAAPATSEVATDMNAPPTWTFGTCARMQSSAVTFMSSAIAPTSLSLG